MFIMVTSDFLRALRKITPVIQHQWSALSWAEIRWVKRNFNPARSIESHIEDVKKLVNPDAMD